VGSLETFYGGRGGLDHVASGLRFADSFDGAIADFLKARGEGRDGAGSPERRCGSWL
jgi:hypothetical protein